MTVLDQFSLIVLFVLAMTLLIDVVALPLKLADRMGYTAPFKTMKKHMLHWLGFVLLGICLPGVVLTTMVCVLRSWDDNNVLYFTIVLFLSGALLGLFLSTDPVDGWESHA